MVTKKSKMALLFRDRIRNIRKNLGQFLAIIFMGAIAVTLFVGLRANALTFQRQVDTAFQEGNIPDLFVTVDHYDSDDEYQLKSILASEGELEGRVYLPARYGDVNVYLYIENTLPHLSKPYGEIQPLVTTDEEHFFYIDKKFKTAENGMEFIPNGPLSIADISIDLKTLGVSQEDYDRAQEITSGLLQDTGKNMLSDGCVRFEAQPTGYMQHPENISATTFSGSLVMMSFATFRDSFLSTIKANYHMEYYQDVVDLFYEYFHFNLENISHVDIYNQFLIRLDEGVDVDTIRNRIREYFYQKEENNLYLLNSKEEMPFYLVVTTDCQQANQFCYVFPFFFFGVALIVILTTLSQIVVEERSQIGTLKALGFKRKEILKSYFFLTFILTSIGSFAGMIIGPYLITFILGTKYNILYSLPSRVIVFPYVSAILTYVFFVLSAFAVTYIVLRKELSLKPCQSMRPETPKFSGTSHIQKNRHIFSLSIAMALRNIRVSLFKSVMVIIGSLGCTMLLLSGFGLQDTLNHGIAIDSANFLNYDIDVHLKREMDALEIEEMFQGEQQISYLEPYYLKEATFFKGDGPQKTRMVYVLSTADTSLGIPPRDDGIVIAKKLAQNINATVGDEISFTIQNQKFTGTIAEIYEAFYFNGAILPQDSPIFEGREIGFNNVWMRILDKEGTQRGISEDLQSKYPDVIGSITIVESLKKKINDVVSAVDLMTAAVKVFALLLAFVVLYNFSRLNFHQRTRDIATLRVLGFRKREISLALLFETMLLTLIGVSLGMLCGYPFMMLILNTNVIDLIEYLPHISILSYGYSFLCTFVVAFLINLYFATKVRNVEMVSSLKSIE